MGTERSHGELSSGAKDLVRARDQLLDDGGDPRKPRLDAPTLRASRYPSSYSSWATSRRVSVITGSSVLMADFSSL